MIFVYNQKTRSLNFYVNKTNTAFYFRRFFWKSRLEIVGYITMSKKDGSHHFFYLLTLEQFLMRASKFKKTTT